MISYTGWVGPRLRSSTRGYGGKVNVLVAGWFENKTVVFAVQHGRGTVIPSEQPTVFGAGLASAASTNSATPEALTLRVMSSTIPFLCHLCINKQHEH